MSNVVKYCKLKKLFFFILQFSTFSLCYTFLESEVKIFLNSITNVFEIYYFTLKKIYNIMMSLKSIKLI